MSQENVELVMRLYQGWFATGELLREFLDENVEVHDHDTPDQGVYQGIAGIERWLRDWGDAWAEWTMDLDILLLLVGVGSIFGLGLLAGYGIRAAISARRRRLFERTRGFPTGLKG